MNTFKLVAVSNWDLYRAAHKTGSMEDYAKHLARLMAMEGARKPDLLVLREKDMGEALYAKLFQAVCEKSQGFSGSGKKAKVVPHTYLSVARQMKTGCIHLPLFLLQKYRSIGGLEGMEEIGVSVHSPEEAVKAQELGAAYLTAGHIFATDCKKGLPPRGLPFLEQVCECVSIPVYAIGGIQESSLSLVRKSGASGACMMSEYMKLALEP